MNVAAQTPGNVTKIRQLEAAWIDVLRQVLERGFHGTAALEIAVQDGVIQHLRRRVERVER